MRTFFINPLSCVACHISAMRPLNSYTFPLHVWIHHLLSQVKYVMVKSNFLKNLIFCCQIFHGKFSMEKMFHGGYHHILVTRPQSQLMLFPGDQYRHPQNNTHSSNNGIILIPKLLGLGWPNLEQN